MKKLILLISAALCLCTTLAGVQANNTTQNKVGSSMASDQSGFKKWTIEQATNDRSLLPKNYMWGDWGFDNPNKLFCRWENILISYDTKTKKIDTIANVEMFNETIELNFKDDYCKSLPPIRSVANDGGVFIKYKSATYKWYPELKKMELHSSVPEEVKNVAYNENSGYLTYTKDNNLYVIKDGIKFAITKDENPEIVNGQIVHRNEFGIDKGVFWSPDGKKLAFYRMDESNIRQAPLSSFSNPKEEGVEYTRYPEAGTPTHKVSVGVYNIVDFTTVFLEPYPLDNNEPPYITGITWSEDGKYIYTVELNRDQNYLVVLCFDAITGKLKHKLFEERNPIYVEPENPVIFRPKKPDQIIWNSERSGYNHLYLYNTKGEFIKEITPSSEKWEVSSVLECSPDGKYIYFMGTKDSPLQQNLYSVNINNGQVKRLSPQDGVHNIKSNGNGEYFFDKYSSHTMPAAAQILDKNGKIVKTLYESADPLASYNKPENRLITLKSADGVTDLYALLTLPVGFDSTKKYPVLVYVYGGPHLQLVKDTYLYGSNMFLQTFAQEGFIVFSLDNRGSANRGFDFESSIHRNIGKAEVEDQMKGIEFLKTLPYIDENRIGVNGWSYGGFMTMSLKLRYPQLFKVAVSGGGVINWEWYEIMYGERYMDTPQDNPQGYQYANLLNLVDSVSDKILMIHGGLDATVLPKHSFYFIDKCIEKGKQIDFFIYPNHEHNVRGKDRAHLNKKILDYFKDNL